MNNKEILCLHIFQVCGSMPYDDSNIKRMVKDQIDRKVQFSKSKKISDECKSLVYKILEVNIKKRFTIGQMYEHIWLNTGDTKGIDAEATKMEKLNPDAAGKINLDGVKSGKTAK